MFSFVHPFYHTRDLCVWGCVFLSCTLLFWIKPIKTREHEKDSKTKNYIKIRKFGHWQHRIIFRFWLFVSGFHVVILCVDCIKKTSTGEWSRTHLFGIQHKSRFRLQSRTENAKATTTEKSQLTSQSIKQHIFRAKQRHMIESLISLLFWKRWTLRASWKRRGKRHTREFVCLGSNIFATQLDFWDQRISDVIEFCAIWFVVAYCNTQYFPWHKQISVNL